MIVIVIVIVIENFRGITSRKDRKARQVRRGRQSYAEDANR